tara:strand:+ start:1255 stop:1419 length:165 start_codon:yes stop_codon:yes gene_type:complete
VSKVLGTKNEVDSLGNVISTPKVRVTVESNPEPTEHELKIQAMKSRNLDFITKK